ncbi:orotidine-5'-phosphate decarboxylase [Commensalibacter melissae]|uniref:orotidine-5'-phosphate decarboxylase n=1 Tax=Commensalibacter melissae TaxID=2070537 RepID=UPI000EFCB70A|nr:orotidine-5'-phosphate decarboxylase [Commensalibacter melissae]AYN87458.1 orotidine-5'-phosphate decarboxylase [Commensalibacter melissae]
MTKTGLILAIDTKDYDLAEQWAQIADLTGQMIKIGMEFTYACGFDAVRKLARGRQVFLDLKLHDIPNTVASAIASLVSVKPAMLTIHTLGGKDMIKAARKAIDVNFPDNQKPLLLGVTVLTSMDQENLNSVNLHTTPLEQVMKLAGMALDAGVDGLVCSPEEVATLRKIYGDKVVLVVPGIRLENAKTDDQKRIMTPALAHKAGANWIVVGRPITQSANPQQVAEEIICQLQD